MSWQSMDAVIRHSQSSGAAFTTLMIIAHHADKHGQNSYPSLSALIAETRLSERSVQYALKELVAMGELSIARGYTASKDNPYSVVLTPTDSTQIEAEEVEIEAEEAELSAKSALPVESESAKSALLSAKVAPSSADFALSSAKSALALSSINSPLTIQEHPPNNRARASAREKPDYGYPSFDAFFDALWKAGPWTLRKAKARIAAQDMEPPYWLQVVAAAGNYSRSSRPLRGYVRNPDAWLTDGDWLDYVDAPVIEPPKQGEKNEKVVSISVADEVRRTRERMDAVWGTDAWRNGTTSSAGGTSSSSGANGHG